METEVGIFMIKRVFILLVILIVFNFDVSLLKEDQEIEQADKGEEGEAKQMDAWQEYAEPGQAHRRFERMIGTWDATIKMWSKAYPETFVSKGISKNELIMEGRYLKVSFEGVFEDMKFEGVGISGYDNFKKKYFSIWFDSIGTGYYLVEGKCEENVCNYFGTAIDPEHKYEYKTHEIQKFIDDNRWINEVYQADNSGKEFKTMEITYTKVK